MAATITDIERKLNKHRVRLRRSVSMLCICIAFGLTSVGMLESVYTKALSPASLVDLLTCAACAIGIVVCGLNAITRREQVRKYRRRLKHLKEIQKLEDQFKL